MLVSGIQPWFIDSCRSLTQSQIALIMQPTVPSVFRSPATGSSQTHSPAILVLSSLSGLQNPPVQADQMVEHFAAVSAFWLSYETVPCVNGQFNGSATPGDQRYAKFAECRKQTRNLHNFIKLQTSDYRHCCKMLASCAYSVATLLVSVSECAMSPQIDVSRSTLLDLRTSLGRYAHEMTELMAALDRGR